MAYAGINEILPNKYRALGLAWTEFCIGPMNIFAPLVAHSLIESGAAGLAWRWLYIIGIILGTFSFVGTGLVYFPPTRLILNEDSPMRFQDLDFLGFFLYCSGISVFLVGLTWGGVQFAWNSAATIAPLTIGLVLMISAVLWGFSGIPKRPIFPWILFRKFREFTAPVIVISMAGFCFLSTIPLLPQQLQFVYGATGTQIGIYQLSQGFGTFFGSVILAGFIHKIKHFTLQIVVGLCVQTLFLGLYALETPQTLSMALAFQFFANVPFGWLTVLCTTTVGLNVPQRHLGLAYGILGLSRCAGGAMGAAILSTIVNGKLTLPSYILEAVAPYQLPAASAALPLFIAAFSSGELEIASSIPGITPEILSAAQSGFQYAYAYAFRIAYLATIPFGVAATIVGACVKDPSKYLTNHVAVHVQKTTLRSTKPIDETTNEKHGSS